MSLNSEELFPITDEGTFDEVAMASPDAATLVPIALIHPNPSQPRRMFSKEELQELCDSIRSERSKGAGIDGTGLWQPILLRRMPIRHDKKVSYQIVFGERRFRAFQMAGFTDIPAVIKDMSETRAIEVALIENVIRDDMERYEKAVAYRALMNLKGYSIRKLSEAIGKNRGEVYNTLQILNLQDDALSLITTRDDSVSVAQLINKVKDEGLRKKWIADYKAKKASYQDIEARYKLLQQQLREEKDGQKDDTPKEEAEETAVLQFSHPDPALPDPTLSYGSAKSDNVVTLPKSPVVSNLNYAASNLETALSALGDVEVLDEEFWTKELPKQIKTLKALIDGIEDRQVSYKKKKRQSEAKARKKVAG